jgi:hypothetical protein
LVVKLNYLFHKRQEFKEIDKKYSITSKQKILTPKAEKEKEINELIKMINELLKDFYRLISESDI